MAIFARRYELPLWWDESHLKQRWRAYSLAKAGERAVYLAEFYALLVPAMETFRAHVETLEAPESQRRGLEAQNLLALLTLLETQTQQKLAGERVQLLKASLLWPRICVALARASTTDFKETEYGHFCARPPIISVTIHLCRLSVSG